MARSVTPEIDRLAQGKRCQPTQPHNATGRMYPVALCRVGRVMRALAGFGWAPRGGGLEQCLFTGLVRRRKRKLRLE